MCVFLAVALMVVFLVVLTLLVIVLSPHKFLHSFFQVYPCCFLSSRREQILMINFTKYKTAQNWCIEKLSKQQWLQQCRKDCL